MFDKSDSIGQLSAAMAQAQGAFDSVTRDSTNPHFRSKYASLAAIWDSIRPVLAKHGLAVVQFPKYANGVVELTTILMHGESGEWLSETSGAPIGKADAQGVGSALTYLRRYSLSSVLGIVTEDDDDGNAASAPAKQTAQAKPANVPKERDDTKLISSAQNIACANINSLAKFIAEASDGTAVDAIKAASEFTNADGEVQSFTDPLKIKSERWLQTTYGKLKKRAIELGYTEDK